MQFFVILFVGVGRDSCWCLPCVWHGSATAPLVFPWNMTNNVDDNSWPRVLHRYKQCLSHAVSWNKQYCMILLTLPFDTLIFKYNYISYIRDMYICIYMHIHDMYVLSTMYYNPAPLHIKHTICMDPNMWSLFLYVFVRLSPTSTSEKCVMEHHGQSLVPKCNRLRVFCTYLIKTTQDSPGLNYYKTIPPTLWEFNIAMENHHL